MDFYLKRGKAGTTRLYFLFYCALFFTVFCACTAIYHIVGQRPVDKPFPIAAVLPVLLLLFLNVGRWLVSVKFDFDAATITPTRAIPIKVKYRFNEVKNVYVKDVFAGLRFLKAKTAFATRKLVIEFNKNIPRNYLISNKADELMANKIVENWNRVRAVALI